MNNKKFISFLPYILVLGIMLFGFPMDQRQ